MGPQSPREAPRRLEGTPFTKLSKPLGSFWGRFWDPGLRFFDFVPGPFLELTLEGFSGVRRDDKGQLEVLRSM